MDKEKKPNQDKWNSITCGDIALESSELSFKELAEYFVGFINEAGVKSYMDLVKQKKLMGESPSYID